MDKVLGLLLDFTFRKSATPHLVRYLYIFALVLLGIQALLLILGGFAKGIVAGIIAIVIAPLVCLCGAAFLRVGLETVVAIHRATNYLAEMARATRQAAPGAEGEPPQREGTTQVSMIAKSGF